MQSTLCSLFLPLLLLGEAVAEPQIINLLQFSTDEAQRWERIQRRSDSLPLNMDELQRLSKAGIDSETLVEMMRTRKVLALADVDNMLRLKRAGADDQLIAALSAYAWPPNEQLILQVNLDLISPDTLRQAPHLYIELEHLERGQQEALFHADLRRSRSSKRQDRSDPLLPERIHSFYFRVPVQSRHWGKLRLNILLSQEQGLRSLRSGKQRLALQSFELNYPAVSLEQSCELHLRAERDPLLKELFTLRRSEMKCHWD